MGECFNEALGGIAMPCPATGGRVRSPIFIRRKVSNSSIFIIINGEFIASFIFSRITATDPLEAVLKDSQIPIKRITAFPVSGFGGAGVMPAPFPSIFYPPRRHSRNRLNSLPCEKRLTNMPPSGKIPCL